MNFPPLLNAPQWWLCCRVIKFNHKINIFDFSCISISSHYKVTFGLGLRVELKHISWMKRKYDPVFIVANNE